MDGRRGRSPGLSLCAGGGGQHDRLAGAGAAQLLCRLERRCVSQGHHHPRRARSDRRREPLWPRRADHRSGLRAAHQSGGGSAGDRAAQPDARRHRPDQRRDRGGLDAAWAEAQLCLHPAGQGEFHPRRTAGADRAADARARRADADRDARRRRRCDAVLRTRRQAGRRRVRDPGRCRAVDQDRNLVAGASDAGRARSAADGGCEPAAWRRCHPHAGRARHLLRRGFPRRRRLRGTDGVFRAADRPAHCPARRQPVLRQPPSCGTRSCRSRRPRRAR